MSNIADDANLNYTPSCTVEDAAMYLMGYPQSYLQAKWMQYSDDPSDGEWLSIEGYQYLAEELDFAKSALAEAKFDKASEEVIAAKQAEITKCAHQVKLAHKYKTAIINELAKGVGFSRLHIDSTATLDARNPFITLLSLKRWAHESLNISILNELDTVKPIKTVSMARQQENVILDAIKKLGHDPQNLPKLQAGKAGVKATIKKTLMNHTLFKDKTTVFKRTWERLSGDNEIGYMQ